MLNIQRIFSYNHQAMLLQEVPNYRQGTFIDVRSLEEFALVHAEGAVNIPWYRSERLLNELPHYSKPWMFACEEGVRAGLVVFSLRMLGFEEVYNIGRWLDLPGEPPEG